jgi:hypothetical protein
LFSGVKNLTVEARKRMKEKTEKGGRPKLERTKNLQDLSLEEECLKRTL